MARPARATLVVLVLLGLAVLWFGKLPGRALAHPDEGRYAEIAREMALTGDYVTPRLNGLKYFEKPPLQYWTTALAYRAFGVSEWTARLWTALTGLAAVVATWFAGRRLFGARAGGFGALALLASPYYVVMSGANSLDMGVSALLSMAVLAYLLSRQAAPGAPRRAWMLAAWACMALAVLSKGLIGIVLPGGALAAYSLLERDLRAWRDLYALPGLALFLAIAAPWFVLVARANPEFLHFFFVHEHFQRFTSDVHSRTGPIWYFVPIVVFAASPWLPAALVAVRDALRRATPTAAVSPARFLVAWCAVVFVFFSVSRSKLPGYVLPMVPALALLAGDALARVDALRALRWLSAGALALGVAAFVGIHVLELSGFGPLDSAYWGFEEWSEWGAVLILAAGGVSAWWAGRLSSDRLIEATLVAFFAAATVGVFGYAYLAPVRSAQAIVAEIRAAGADVPVYAVRDYDQTLPFYLGRTVTLVAFVGEFATGIAAQPQLQVPTLEAFAQRWAADPDAFAVMSRETHAALAAAGVPMAVVREERKRLLVRKPRG